MRQPILCAAIVAIAALPCAAHAAHRKPGQWEITSQMHFVKGGMQIPPEIQAQMKARGIKLPAIGAPHTFKQCLTPEQAARDEHPDFSQGKSCKTQNTKWSGNRFHAEFICNGREGPQHGTLDGNISNGGKHYAGTFRVEGDNPQMGGHFVMEGQASGKWLGPICRKSTS